MVTWSFRIDQRFLNRLDSVSERYGIDRPKLVRDIVTYGLRAIELNDGIECLKLLPKTKWGTEPGEKLDQVTRPKCDCFDIAFSKEDNKVTISGPSLKLQIRMEE